MPGNSDQGRLRIGLDLGGSKIEGILLSPEATELARYRVATPRDDYGATIAAIVDLTSRLTQGVTTEATIGIAVPGSISPHTGLMQNANSTWLNGQPFDRDLTVALARPVRLANDANCFALSEAIDGAAKNARIIFGVILGTGCGCGLVVNGRPLDGPRGIGGEWGHNPLPWATPDEYPGPSCCRGRKGCLETWVSGLRMAADHTRVTGETHSLLYEADCPSLVRGRNAQTLRQHWALIAFAALTSASPLPVSRPGRRHSDSLVGGSAS